MRVSASARLLPLPRIHLVPIIILDLPMPQKTHRAERTNSVQPTNAGNHRWIAASTIILRDPTRLERWQLSDRLNEVMNS
jgi:hypothetical protein